MTLRDRATEAEIESINTCSVQFVIEQSNKVKVCKLRSSVTSKRDDYDDDEGEEEEYH